MIPKKHWKLIGLYFEDDPELKQEMRDIMLDKYLDQTDNDVSEALGMMAWRLEKAEGQESYEECAIIKDILDYFEYFPRG